MEKLNKTKTPNYASYEEGLVIKEELLKKKEILEQEIVDLENKYLSLGKAMQSRRRRNVNALFKINKKIEKIKSKIQMIKIDLIKIEEGKYIKLNAFEKVIKKIKGLSYQQQKVVCGIIFVIPWLLGFIFFFAKPLLTTIWWSFNEVTPQAGGLDIQFKGVQNYINLFTTQMLGTKTFLEVMTTSLTDLVLNVPIIFIFSLIISVILNTKFKGHQILKAIFFIPVVYNATVINTALNGSFGGQFSGSMGEAVSMSGLLTGYLYQIGFASGLVDFLVGAVDRIFEIVNMSGIQILIFIAALQGVPKHLYEAAKVEGATTYECFWKITFPMVSPMFLPILVYSIVDTFASSDLMQFMTVNSEGSKIAYGMSSTIAVIYFLVILLIIGILFLLLRKVVYSSER